MNTSAKIKSRIRTKENVGKKVSQVMDEATLITVGGAAAIWAVWAVASLVAVVIQEGVYGTMAAWFTSIIG